jgi:hypothetical protein
MGGTTSPSDVGLFRSSKHPMYDEVDACNEWCCHTQLMNNQSISTLLMVSDEATAAISLMATHTHTWCPVPGK